MRKYSLFPLLFLTTTLFSQGISPAQQRKLVQALSAISSLYVDTINDTRLTLIDLKTAKDRVTDLILSGDLQEKRYCLTILIDKIIIDDDHVNIIIRQT